jgi:hypothetical protein
MSARALSGPAAGVVIVLLACQLSRAHSSPYLEATSPTIQYRNLSQSYLLPLLQSLLSLCNKLDTHDKQRA